MEPAFDNPAGSGTAELVALDADHPGFRDETYKRRRQEIARVALDYREGDPVPRVAYTDDEHEVWREVWRNLDPLHDQFACNEYLTASERIALSRENIPQLVEVNETVQPLHGFRMCPVAGLVTARDFLGAMSRRVFLSTQYMRHHSVPLYTPEPDVVHELVGHAATFAHDGFVRLNRAFGEAALRVHDEELVKRLGQLYWYTIEFGAVRENDKIKVFGAGLLSSFGEIGKMGKDAPLVHDWDIETIASTPYDPTQYQKQLFVAPSFDALTNDLVDWLDKVQ
jgi:phenylalanine-4-hydroxylase